jgi:hypothetical protein
MKESIRPSSPQRLHNRYSAQLRQLHKVGISLAARFQHGAGGRLLPKQDREFASRALIVAAALDWPTWHPTGTLSAAISAKFPRQTACTAEVSLIEQISSRSNE